ncbi:MAG: flagellar biosynthesis protein FlhB [Psychromonas sp.]|nr:flagellar biosynthesis protein FlhB [Psychromonas sp.]
MAENENGSEKTEDPTGKRIQKSRDDGQVPRSKELASASVLISAASSFLIFGGILGHQLVLMMTTAFTFERSVLFSPEYIWLHISNSFSGLAFPMFIILFTLFIISLLGSTLLGGIIFNTKSMIPKLNKFSPIAGLKRMMGPDAWVNLLKSLLKIFVVIGMAAFIFYSTFERILHLSMSSLPGSMFEALDMISWMFLLLSLSLLLIVAIDVPYRIYKHKKDLKMTKDEVKDEIKDVEGNPKVKQRIRQLQYESSQRKMMGDVPEADVIVTNPTHYSVAIKYDTTSNRAPYVVAKGVDVIALKIREIARAYEIPIMSSPPLCRAIYHTTEINDEVPEDLFVAVAQVLAYIYQLNQFRQGKTTRPRPLPKDLKIPPAFRFNN